MPSADARRAGPCQVTGSQKIATTTPVPTIPLAPDVLRDLDAMAEHLRGRFVVQTQTEGDKFRTVVYGTAKAAENAVRRGNGRGKRVHVSLCQLLPVGVVVGLAGGH